MLGGAGARFEGETFGDVYIDDLIVLVMSRSMSIPAELTARLAAADGICRELKMTDEDCQER